MNEDFNTSLMKKSPETLALFEREEGFAGDILNAHDFH
jgi:hypothetical protein